MMMTGMQIFSIMVIMPILAALAILIIPKKFFIPAAVLSVASIAIALVAAIMNFGNDLIYTREWLSFGLDFSLRLDTFSQFATLATCGFALLVAIYSIGYLRDKAYASRFFFYFVFTVAFTNGALLANNLILMLFFWEGLLVALFGMFLASGKHLFPTAVKAFTLNGIADLFLMLGIGITIWITGTSAMDMITPIPVEGIAILGFIMMMLGAIGKSGSMPFHSWIPDAAEKAPMPLLALLPGALEKILGIYLLSRIVLNFYKILPHSTMSTLMMVIGALTIVFAIFMALIQKNYAKSLAYHAISQVGYMVIGIGTALPVGIVGGIFQMINHAVYKSSLFMNAGAIEKQTGATDLSKMGGLGKHMPVTTISFLLTAFAACSVPFFSGFFSKEMLLDAGIEAGFIYYLVMLGGAFLTTALFLKIGHAAFFDKPANPELKKTKEAPLSMLIPMLIPAILCLVFGLGNRSLVAGVIEPIVGQDLLQGHSFAGWPASGLLVTISIVVIVLAILHHYLRFLKKGRAVQVLDHFRNAPVLCSVYNAAEKKYLDPYNILMAVIMVLSWIAYGIDRGINWVYDVLLVKIYNIIAKALMDANDGNQARYIVWSLFGLFIVLFIFIVLM